MEEGFRRGRGSPVIWIVVGFVVGSVLVMLALVSAVTAGPDAGEAGRQLSTDSPDINLQTRVLTSADLCYVDDDANGGYSADEPVILRMSGSCSGKVGGQDIRLSTWAGQSGGQRVLTGHERGATSSSVNGAAFWFLDSNGNGHLDEGDTAYANMNSPTVGTVTIGDVRLSSFEELPPFTVVQSGDADMSSTLMLLGQPDDVVAHVDADGDRLLGTDEIVYLKARARTDDVVGYGDLRITEIDTDRPAGSFVTVGDGDGFSLLHDVSLPVCYFDEDGSGGLSMDDPVILAVRGDCSTVANVGDLRLSTSSHGTAGSRITATDGDIGVDLVAIPDATVAYADADGDGGFTVGDALYVDLVAPDSGRVDVGDLRLSPYHGPSGHYVDLEDEDVGVLLADLGDFEEILTFSPGTGSASPAPQDPFYLNVDRDQDGRVETGDVRLFGLDERPFGGSATLRSGEAVASLVSGTARVCFLLGSNGDYAAGDPVYLRMSGTCDSVAPGDIRLGGGPGIEFGSVVRGGDPEIGATVTLLSDAPEWRYVDSDGDGEWSLGDTLYLDIRAQSALKVNIGDIRVSRFQERAAGMVTSGDLDLDRPLRHMNAVSSITDFADLDENGLFNRGDVAYVNVDGVGDHATVLDVRLVGLPAEPQRFTPSPASDTSSPTPTLTPDRGQGASPTPTQSLTDTTDSPTGQPEPTGAPTPGVGTVVLLIALLGIVFLARRRSQV